MQNEKKKKKLKIFLLKRFTYLFLRTYGLNAHTFF